MIRSTETLVYESHLSYDRVLMKLVPTYLILDAGAVSGKRSSDEKSKFRFSRKTRCVNRTLFLQFYSVEG